MKRLDDLVRIFKMAAGHSHAGGSDAFQNRIEKSMAAAANFVRSMSDSFAEARVVAVAREGEPVEMNGAKMAAQDAEAAAPAPAPAASPDGKQQPMERIASVEGTARRDVKTMDGTQKVGAVNTGAGRDVVDVAGGVKRVHGGADGDRINVSGETVRSVQGGTGGDRVMVEGETVGAVSGGKGRDRLSVAAQDVSVAKGGVGGDRVVVVAETVGRVDGGRDNDQLRVRATAVESVEGGHGNDRIDVAAVSAGTVDGGVGNDTMRIAAMTATVAGGRGDDDMKLNVEVARMTFGAGDGNDTVRLGQGTQLLLDFGEGLTRDGLQIEQMDADGRSLLLKFDSGESVTLNRVHIAESIALSFADGEVVALRGEAFSGSEPPLDAKA